MRDTMEIGSGPADENVAQIGVEDDAPQRNRAECKALVGQMRRILGDEPFGASLFVKSNPHDFGTYREVAVSYDDSQPEAVEYAFKAERSLPAKWDEQAIKELTEAGFPPR